MSKKIKIVASILGMFFVVMPIGIVGIYFSDNIKGYFKFKHLCETEGGLKVYEKLERNVGWEVERKRNAYVPAYYENVAFVRFQDKSKKIDIKYKEGPREFRKSFDFIDADLSLKTKYKYIYEDKRLDDRLLVSRTVFKVIDIESASTALEFVSFGYSMFDRNKTILAAPSATRCFKFDLAMIGDNFE